MEYRALSLLTVYYWDYGLFWTIVDYTGTMHYRGLWRLVISYALPWTIMDYGDESRISKGHQLWTIVDCHGSWIVMDYRTLLLIIIHYRNSCIMTSHRIVWIGMNCHRPASMDYHGIALESLWNHCGMTVE